MAKGTGTMYLAWGGNIDRTDLTDQQKIEKRSTESIANVDFPTLTREKEVTTAYVAGPGFRFYEADLVSFIAVVVVKGSATTLFFKVEHSFDGVDWAPSTAGISLAGTGVAPDREAVGEILPSIRKWVIPTLPIDQKVSFNYQQRGNFSRILVLADSAVTPAEIFIQAGA